MNALFWHLANRSAEIEFIFSLVQSLVAGLALLVLLRQLRAARLNRTLRSDRVLLLGLLPLASQFALRALYFGIGFYFHTEPVWPGVERLAHALGVCGFMLVAAAHLDTWRESHGQLVRWSLGAFLALVLALVIDIAVPWPTLGPGERTHTVTMVVSDIVAAMAATIGTAVVLRMRKEGWQASAVALTCVSAFLLLHVGGLVLSPRHGALVWSAEQHVLLIALFALAWTIGERSYDMLGRVFLRLNLTFIVLASLILLVTTGMEKYQYLHLAEERSLDLAEFLRGHAVYYSARRETLADMFHRPEVLRRVVVEFGTLPELRGVHVYLDGQRVSFHYGADWEVKEEIVPAAQRSQAGAETNPVNSFRMIGLPIETGTGRHDRVELIGTMDYINAYIGRYIILIYCLFTLTVGLATGVIGIIVTDAERQRRRQYAELQETHERLAQAAKLASVGQLAGGMAHEINTPMTSILSLATHLTDARNAATLTPDQRRNLEVIAGQAQRASKIVNDLLTFARQSRLELNRVDVGELLETAIGLLHYRFNDGAIQIRREIDDDLPPLLADAGRVTEVFVSLLNNAADAMPAGGTLTLRASASPDAPGAIRVEVTDTGFGIPPQDLPRIFDPFFTTKQPGHGTGLGLSISHSIVKDHGGQIWAESSVGAGTTVGVTLPAEGEAK